MNKHKSYSIVGLYLFLAACVTVNIYFPAAAAEEAADKIIKDIYGKDPKSSRDKKQPDGSPSSGLLDKALDLIVPRAQAQQPDIDISTPGINTLRDFMKSRHPALVAFYQNGAVGLTKDGLLSVRDVKVIALEQRNQVKQLIAEENRDRNALYAEIARANGHPEWEPQIRATFASRWVANAPGGWWYQDASGQWRQK